MTCILSLQRNVSKIKIVLFDNVGYKTLAIEIVTERHLLKVG